MTSSTIQDALGLEIKEKVQEVLDEFNEPQSETRFVYHYTNLEGLLGILKEKRFRASSSIYLNDKKEFTNGLEVFSQDLFANFCGSDISKVVLEELGRVQVSNKFVTSFSVESDLLSQWRGYADDGRGVAVGIDRLKFKELLDDNLDINVEDFFVIYDDDRKKEIARKVVSVVLSNIHDKISDNSEVIKFAQNELVKNAVRVAGYFKDSAFKEEKEFRFEKSLDLNTNLSDVFHRISKNGLLVPYTHITVNTVPFKSNSLPISKIIIGPSLNFELNKRAIQQMLLKSEYNLDEVEISASEIPYRI